MFKNLLANCSPSSWEESEEALQIMYARNVGRVSLTRKVTEQQTAYLAVRA